MIKSFVWIEDIKDEETRDRYADFWWLNSVLEQWKCTVEDVRRAYEELLLWDKLSSDYTELDFQVKYLLDDIWMWVNRIMDFLEDKFVPYDKDLKRLLLEGVIVDKSNKIYFPEELVQSIVDIMNKNSDYNKIKLFVIWNKGRVCDLPLSKDQKQEDIYNSVMKWIDQVKKLLNNHKLEHVWCEYIEKIKRK